MLSHSQMASAPFASDLATRMVLGSRWIGRGRRCRVLGHLFHRGRCPIAVYGEEVLAFEMMCGISRQDRKKGKKKLLMNWVVVRSI